MKSFSNMCDKDLSICEMALCVFTERLAVTKDFVFPITSPPGPDGMPYGLTVKTEELKATVGRIRELIDAIRQEMVDRTTEF